jgi:signal transduction histidine kinase
LAETCVLSLIASRKDPQQADEVDQAEATLASMARRLMQAQDEERSSVARELHEYVERLVLLSIDLDRVRQSPPTTAAEIEDAQQQIERLVLDLQSLSHRLHSTVLEFLGLEAAASRFCKELEAQASVSIEFVSQNNTHDLPREVSLCLFRVLQEALQYAVSAGARHLQVTLRREPSLLELTVRAVGEGIRAESPAGELALVLPRERLKLVGGEFSVRSAENGVILTAADARWPTYLRGQPEAERVIQAAYKLPCPW